MVRVTDIFEYPLSDLSPKFAFAQREHTAVVFIKSPDIQFSDSTRIVFWFARNPTPVKSDEDYVDVPDEAIPLLMALFQKRLLESVKKPIPPEIEREIVQETARVKKNGNIQNYYIGDTFNLTPEQLSNLSLEDDEQVDRSIWRKGIKEAVTWVLEEMDKRPKVKQIVICGEFLSQWVILGKEDLTPEQLSNNVSQRLK